MESENLDLDLIQTTAVPLTSKCETSLHDDESLHYNSDEKSEVFQTEIGSIVKESILHSLRKVYAELLVTVTVMAVFIEILHGSVPLFHIHAYFYFYLLGVSILIFVGSFGRVLIYKLNGKEISQECESGILKKNNNYLNLSVFFMFGLVACGLAAVISTSLGLAAVITSGTCLNVINSSLSFLHFIFISLQLIFLFMNAKRLIDVFGCFHKMSIMHLAATNIAVWFHMLLFESSKDWQEALHDVHNSSLAWSQKDLNISLHSLDSDINSLNTQDHFPKHVVRVTSNCWWRVISEFEEYEDILSVHLCLQNSSIGAIWKKTSDVLYPAVVQHYLIILFLLYISWKSMTIRCKIQCSSLVPVESQRSRYCFCCSILLFSVFLIASIIIVIFCLILDVANFDIIVLSMFMVIFASSICAVLYGLFQMKSLERNIKPENQNHTNYYQVFGTYFVYVYAACRLFAGSLSGAKYSSLLIIEALLMIFHAVFQNIYIEVQSVKKSKLVVVVLLVCNLSLWVLESFVFCSKSLTLIEAKIFGAVAWPIINRIIVPCLAFYRFHCVIVLLGSLKV